MCMNALHLFDPINTGQEPRLVCKQHSIGPAVSSLHSFPITPESPQGLALLGFISDAEI